ncbi:MAG: AIR synthase related protein [Bdellovibrionales bacterium]
MNLNELKNLWDVNLTGRNWALFSALWSEHCSYKSSKVHNKSSILKMKRVLESFGENAGVIEKASAKGKVAFKMESHNHPSYISPHQGAATGVGGILKRHIHNGCRPIALANYLCFGDASEKNMPHLVDGVVRGIADYGNCVGVPMVTGSTEFHRSYNGNIW